MRLLVFGATGRTGRHLARMAGTAGFALHAAGRDSARGAALAPKMGWSPIEDLSDTAAVLALIRAASPDAIVSLIGSPPGAQLIDETGNIAIADAARMAGVRRLIQASSLGCGDSRPFASERLLAAIGTVLEAKTRAEDYLRRLDLDWTILRPGGLTDGDQTGNGVLYADPGVHGRIARADLAALILACVDAEQTVGKVLSVVDRTGVSDRSALREIVLLRQSGHS